MKSGAKAQEVDLYGAFREIMIVRKSKQRLKDKQQSPLSMCKSGDPQEKATYLCTMG